MSGALVPRLSGRPVIIQFEGWTEFVSVHDQAFLAERRKWKDRLKESHPDWGGSATKFRLAFRAFKQWMLREEQWYRMRGLTPPEWGGH